MQRKGILISISLLFIALLITAGTVKAINFFKIDINHLPKGTLIKEVQSPDKKHSIKIYLVNGGATVDFAVRGELIFNSKHKKKKNIYWVYHRDDAEVHWESNNIVNINGVKLKIPDEVYDYRLEK
ncbi:DUF5412 family protein [Cohnella sp. 56]|uniref:DUF5412 family protein n=1 Tax=Cohnella sp. 56 TaxID=3113722 RepID=UPI0030EAA177